MKKLLSMLLALTLVMSLFCVVPVSAAGTEFTLPYISYDFNDIADGATSNYGDDFGTWNAKKYIEGVAGDKALYIDETATNGSAYLMLTLKNGSGALNTMKEAYKISFWLKLDTTKSRFDENSSLLTTNLNVLFQADKRGYSNNNIPAQISALNTGEWVYYEKEFPAWSGVTTYNSGADSYDNYSNTDNVKQTFTIRLGHYQGSAPNSTMQEGYKEKYAIAIDDFRIEPVRTPYAPDNATEDDAAYEPERIFYASLNTNTTTDGPQYVSISGGTNPEKSVPSSGGVNNSGYMKIDRGVSSAGQIANKNSWCDITFTQTGSYHRKYNTLTKISFWAKAEDANSVGTKLALRLYYASLLDANGKGTNLCSGDYHYIDIPQTLTDEWKQYSVYYKRNIKSFDESGDRVAIQTMNPNSNGIVIGIDELEIYEYVIPTNMEFEDADIPATNSVNSAHTSSMTGEDSLKYATDLYGWIAGEGATVTAVADKRTGSEGTQAAKVVTSAANTNGGIYQGIYLENNKEYEFRVWAKGEGDSIGKDLKIVLDRSVATPDADDVYVDDTANNTVKDSVTITLKDSSGSSQLTSQWKEYTGTYKPVFTLKTGITETDTFKLVNGVPTHGTIKNGAFAATAAKKVGIRQPFMYFNVDNGAAGMTYYLDDMEIGEPAPKHPYPFVTGYDMVDKVTLEAVTNVVEGKPVYIDYLPDTEVTGDNVSVIVTRVMIESKAGSNKYGTYATIIDDGAIGLQDFTIPEGFVGRKIKISVQPFSTNGVIGAHYEKVIGTIAKQYEASMTVGAYDPASSSVDITYSVLNNKIDGSAVRAIMFTMFYAEDGTMVKCVENPVVVANGSAVTNATFTATSTASDTNLPAAAKAKVFFWFAGGTETPSVFNTTMEEVVPMQEVSLQ